MYIQCLQSFRSSRAILLHCHCESGSLGWQSCVSCSVPKQSQSQSQMLLGSLPGSLSLPLGLESVCQLVSKSSGSRRGMRPWGRCSLAVGLPLLLLLIYFDLFTIAIYISSLFSYSPPPLPSHHLFPVSNPFSPNCIPLLLLFQSGK